MDNCNNCKSRKNCSKLCSDMEEYVNQDYTPKKYLTFTELGMDDIPIVYDPVKDTNPFDNHWPKRYTRYQLIIDAHEAGIAVKDIAEHTGVSKSYIYKVVMNYTNDDR